MSVFAASRVKPGDEWFPGEVIYPLGLFTSLDMAMQECDLHASTHRSRVGVWRPDDTGSGSHRSEMVGGVCYTIRRQIR